jgi:hypothetical protein
MDCEIKMMTLIKKDSDLPPPERIEEMKRDGIWDEFLRVRESALRPENQLCHRMLQSITGYGTRVHFDRNVLITNDNEIFLYTRDNQTVTLYDTDPESGIFGAPVECWSPITEEHWTSISEKIWRELAR